jgi:AcrR family transcriptional regulator
MQAPDSSPDATEASTSARLLRTAATLFRQKGYARSTTRELAELLGIQKGSLYYHVSKKEDLLYQLCVNSLEHIQKEVEEAIAQHHEPLDRLRALIQRHMYIILADQDMFATVLIELRELSEQRRARVFQLQHAYEALVKATIAEAQHAGVLRQDIPARQQMLALLNLLNWSAFWYHPGGGQTPEELAETFTTIFLDGAKA